MLYELIATVRPRSIAEVKDIAKTAGKLVLSNNGVIRGFTNWGVFALPKPVPNKSGTTTAGSSAGNISPSSSSSQSSEISQFRSPKHTIGHYFIMRFDANARTQHLLRKTWNADPRLLRFSVVKLGEKLEDICDVGGRAEEWAGVAGAEGEQIGREDVEGESEVDEIDALGLDGFGIRGRNAGDFGSGEGLGGKPRSGGYTYAR